MVPHSYRVNNCGSVDLILDKFVFNTPAGIKHTANLVNFGGVKDFTGNLFTVTGSSIPPDEFKTFSIDYEYVSGPNSCRHGNIVISSITGKINTIYTTIEIEDPGTVGFDPIVAKCSLTPNNARWRISMIKCSLTPATATYSIESTEPAPTPTPVPAPVPAPTPTPVPTTPATVYTVNVNPYSGPYPTQFAFGIYATNFTAGNSVNWAITGVDISDIAGIYLDGFGTNMTPVSPLSLTGSIMLKYSNATFCTGVVYVNTASSGSQKTMTLTVGTPPNTVSESATLTTA